MVHCLKKKVLNAFRLRKSLSLAFRKYIAVRMSRPTCRPQFRRNKSLRVGDSNRRVYSTNPHTGTWGLRTPRLKFGKKRSIYMRTHSAWKLEIVLNIYKNSSLFSLIKQTVSVLYCALLYCGIALRSLYKCRLFSNVVCLLKFSKISNVDVIILSCYVVNDEMHKDRGPNSAPPFRHYSVFYWNV